MENRPAALRSRQICRFCLTEAGPLSYIYERNHSKPFQLPLTLQIMSCVSIEVYEADGMPQLICSMCRWNLERSYKFKLQCKKADEALKAYPLSGVLPRPFPSIPNEPPKVSNKRPLEQRSQNDAVKKPCIDNGDRERGETRDRERERNREKEKHRDKQAERERDREKAKDRNKQEEREWDKEKRKDRNKQEEREWDKEKRKDRNKQEERERDKEKRKDKDKQAEKQREKENQHDFYEEEQDADSEGDQDTHSVKKELELEPVEIKVHACNQCDRTFPLRQALSLHVQSAHRDRNYKCTECVRMFFSKYDLGKHMSTHSEDKPFSCPVCNKQFSRANLLQRHEKVHKDELRYGCQHCDREFFTTEELEKHEDSAHKKEKPFQCNICGKRFTYKQGLKRHGVLHSEDKRFVCMYCNEAFRTSSKLARHLTIHAGHRRYLCKLCPRSFISSHHLTRHIRTHTAEKRHLCEDCGKAYKRKEGLEVHQLTHRKRKESLEVNQLTRTKHKECLEGHQLKHTKRTDMELTCDVCQESCRSRANYVTHIKQHIEAAVSQPDNKTKLDLQTDEDEEEEQYSDDDDDFEPPAYIIQKLPQPSKPNRSESEEDENQKERVVVVTHKDRNMTKKTIKSLMPIQCREVQDAKIKQSPNNSQSQPVAKTLQPKPTEESVKTPCVDETEAQVQKIATPVFKEHKIPLTHENATQEQGKESPTSINQSKPQSGQSNSQTVVSVKEEKLETPIPIASTPKALGIMKVIKRIVVRKPSGTTETTTTPVTTKGEISGTMCELARSGHKVTKRVIVRTVIQPGDTTREVVMNLDGMIINPKELAKLPTGNVVKKVAVKKPLDKPSGLIQAALQSSTEQRQQATPVKSIETVVSESPKFEVKTSQPTVCAPSPAPKATVAPVQKPVLTEGDQETKEKLEQLEKRVEQQRLKIEELEARKQQGYEPMEELSPERQDESEDEQQLPLKRVFVKKKQSMYDEEQEYNDNDVTITTLITTTSVTTTPATIPKEETLAESVKEKVAPAEVKPAKTKPVETSQKKSTVAPKPIIAAVVTGREGKQPLITSSKVSGNKQIIVVKSEEPSEVEEMSRDLCSILDSTDSVMEMEETVLSNVRQMPAVPDVATKTTDNSFLAWNRTFLTC